MIILQCFTYHNCSKCPYVIPCSYCFNYPSFQIPKRYSMCFITTQIQFSQYTITFQCFTYHSRSFCSNFVVYSFIYLALISPFQVFSIVPFHYHSDSIQSIHYYISMLHLSFPFLLLQFRCLFIHLSCTYLSISGLFYCSVSLSLRFNSVNTLLHFNASLIILAPDSPNCFPVYTLMLFLKVSFPNLLATHNQLTT